ncbi:MAG: hypothetical protein PVG49_07715 [Desulfobacteraceae bacterium]|jgi:hypothetical protein
MEKTECFLSPSRKDAKEIIWSDYFLSAPLRDERQEHFVFFFAPWRLGEKIRVLRPRGPMGPWKQRG